MIALHAGVNSIGRADSPDVSVSHKKVLYTGPAFGRTNAVRLGVSAACPFAPVTNVKEHCVAKTHAVQNV